jgi:hypothetical protein
VVYVDDAGILKHGRAWYHLVADTLDELHTFAADLDLPERAFHRGARHPHYDIPDDLRERAVERGATPISTRDAVRISRKLRLPQNPTV